MSLDHNNRLHKCKCNNSFASQDTYQRDDATDRKTHDRMYKFSLSFPFIVK